MSAHDEDALIDAVRQAVRGYEALLKPLRPSASSAVKHKATKSTKATKR